MIYNPSLNLTIRRWHEPPVQCTHMKCDKILDVRCLLTWTNWVTTLPSHSKKCSRMVHLDRRTYKHHVFPSSHKAQTRSGVCPRFKDTIIIATGLLHRLFTFVPLCKYIILQRSTKCTQCAHVRACVCRMWFGVRIETYEHAVCHAGKHISQLPQRSI